MIFSRISSDPSFDRSKQAETVSILPLPPTEQRRSSPQPSGNVSPQPPRPSLLILLRIAVLHRQKHSSLRHFVPKHLCQLVDDDDGPMPPTGTSHGNRHMSLSLPFVQREKKTNQPLNIVSKIPLSPPTGGHIRLPLDDPLSIVSALPQNKDLARNERPSTGPLQKELQSCVRRKGR